MQATGYNRNNSITTRPFTVLVNADESIQDKWALYSWNGTAWYRRKLQSYNVELVLELCRLVSLQDLISLQILMIQ